MKGRFRLAIDGITPFKVLYEEYKGKKLYAHAVIKDFLRAAEPEVDNPDECIDTFIVNLKFLGLLRTIAGSEVLIPIEQAIDETPASPFAPASQSSQAIVAGTGETGTAATEKADWTHQAPFQIRAIFSREFQGPRHGHIRRLSDGRENGDTLARRTRFTPSI